MPMRRESLAWTLHDARSHPSTDYGEAYERDVGSYIVRPTPKLQGGLSPLAISAMDIWHQVEVLRILCLCPFKRYKILYLSCSALSITLRHITLPEPAR